MKKVRAKKSLGQHFLVDQTVALRIVEALGGQAGGKVLEIGPGTGVLTHYLAQRPDMELWAIELDSDSVAYLYQHYPHLQQRIVMDDFLHYPLLGFSERPFAIIGNFPYNISTQILFRVFEHKELVSEVVGMFQREVAQRVASGPGSKEYGILSVLLQAFYDIEYLFTVSETVFDPPPKVKSGVIRLVRNGVQKLDCDERLFKTLVKAAFGQRRKTLRNSLRAFPGVEHLPAALLGNRPEQLAVSDFVAITRVVQEASKEAKLPPELPDVDVQE